MTDEELDQPLGKLPDKPLEYTGEKITSVLRAVRKKCMDCCCQVNEEVRLCLVTDCTLYPFRMGKNPYSKKNITEEQRDKMRQRSRKYWNEKKNNGTR